MAAVNGNIFILKIDLTGGGSKVIIGQTSNNIELTSDMLDITSKDSGGFAEFLPGRKSGTVQLDFIYEEPTATTTYVDTAELFTAWTAGTKCSLTLGVHSEGKYYLSMSGYISSISIDAAQNDAVQVSLQFTITGSISYAAYSTGT